MAYDELFLDIKTVLATDRKVRQAIMDRLLRDFSAAWGVTNPENGGYQFSPDEWTKFLRVALSLQTGTDTNTTAGFGGTSSYDVTPQQKRIREQNEHTTQQWSIASSKAYPKSH